MKRVLLLILMVCSFDLFAENLDKKVDAIFKAQIGFVAKNDYKGFISNGSDDFKKNITLEAYNKVGQQVLSSFKNGHEEVFLTTLKQDGYLTYLWKITFKNKSSDLTARMTLDKDDKVSGFWLLP